jgi:hypothetical protein
MLCNRDDDLCGRDTTGGSAKLARTYEPLRSTLQGHGCEKKDRHATLAMTIFVGAIGLEPTNLTDVNRAL